MNKNCFQYFKFKCIYIGHNSPLYGRDGMNYNGSEAAQNWKNINFTINFWINNGCKHNKINLGLAAYGRSFTLKNSTFNKVCLNRFLLLISYSRNY